MNKLLLLLFFTPFSLGMIPAISSHTHKKMVNGFKLTGHVQERMRKRNIDEATLLNALAKGTRYQESEDIELYIYKSDRIMAVVAEKNVVVTAWKDKSLGACKRKMKLMSDLQRTPVSANTFRKFKSIKFKFSDECTARIKERHMTQNLVRDVIKNGTSYPTYSGSKLFVRLPYAALFKDGSVNNVFAGITDKKVVNWIKARNLVIEKNCPSYKSNHPITAKSIRKHITQVNIDLLGD